VTSSGGQVVTGTASPITVTGLTNLTSYFFTVTATNALGVSGNSAPSNNAIPSTYLTGPFYVNATTGLDTNDGAVGTPVKTITRGLAFAGGAGTACTAPCTVNVAAGTYSVGETFPIKMANNVTLTGAGSATTTISGNGSYTPTGYTSSYGTTLVFPPAVTATVSGFKVSGAWDVEAVIDGSTNVTLTSSNIDGLGSWTDGLWILNASTATLTGNTISGKSSWLKGGLYITGTSTVKARGNTISDTSLPAINVWGSGTIATSPTVDLGTSVSAGGNTITGPGIIGGTSGGVGINIVNDANWVYASGNIWHAAVQGASAAGTYSVGSIGVNPTSKVIGNNYSIGTSAGLQF